MQDYRRGWENGCAKESEFQELLRKWNWLNVESEEYKQIGGIQKCGLNDRENGDLDTEVHWDAARSLGKKVISSILDLYLRCFGYCTGTRQAGGLRTGVWHLGAGCLQ